MSGRGALGFTLVIAALVMSTLAISATATAVPCCESCYPLCTGCMDRCVAQGGDLEACYSTCESRNISCLMVCVWCYEPLEKSPRSVDPTTVTEFDPPYYLCELF